MIDIETILHTADLAKLDMKYGLSDDEKPAVLRKLAEEMRLILSQLDIIKEAETGSTDALYSPMIDPPGPRQDTPARDDEAIDMMLDQAPDRLGKLYVVPKIV